jgi:catechol O-methyltransferase
MATNKELINTLFGDEEDAHENSESNTEHHRPKGVGVRVFHAGIEDMLLNHVHEHAIRNNPESILNAVNDFCMSKHWMMHIGPEKAKVIINAIREAKTKHQQQRPKDEKFVIVELGSYCGYSAVRIASELSSNGNEKLICLEINDKCVGWTKSMVEFAGLSDRVTVLHSSVKEISNWKPTLCEFLRTDSPKINILFIDHDKKEYFHDLKSIVDENLLQSGSTVIADNVLSFNTPKQDYLDYVRDASSGPFQSSQCIEGFIEYCTEEEKAEDLSMMKDGIEISVFR